jgi:hypothetical protein
MELAVMEIVLFVAIFVGIMAISALVFGGWFIVMVVRGIATFLGLRSADAPPRLQNQRARPIQSGPPGEQRLCPYELCKSTNDLSARFCRRCGRELGAPRVVRVQRAAAW